MLKVDGHLVAEHHIDHGHKFTIDRNSCIGDMQWPFGVMQFSFWYGIAERARAI
jgi:hypothetical protein